MIVVWNAIATVSAGLGGNLRCREIRVKKRRARDADPGSRKGGEEEISPFKIHDSIFI
jgi:hypothetical protein